MLRLSSITKVSQRSFSTSQTASISQVSGHYDAIIIGGGIGGAAAALGITTPSLASEIASAKSLKMVLDENAPRKRVLVLERERDFCYHSTGRSAAIYSEVYGSPSVRALSTATKPFFYNPVAMGLAKEDNLVIRRGSLWAATKATAQELKDIYNSTLRLVPSLRMLSLAEVHALCPWTHNPQPKPVEEQDPDIVALFGGEDADYQVTLGMLEPDAADMDVNSIWQSMMAVAKANGTTLVSASGVSAASRSGGVWSLTVAAENADPKHVTADLVVNAGGAWADEVAAALGVSACGLTPRQRTIIQFDPNEVAGGLAQQPGYLQQQSTWPSVFDLADRYYYKPDGGRVLASPCDEVPVPAHDCTPDELAQAVCVDRLERSSALRPQRISQSWAGLRTFATDREFVLGLGEQDVMWVAGLGGYGIQTALGNARYIAGLVHRGTVSQDLRDWGVDAQALSPKRFTDAAAAKQQRASAAV